MELLSIVAKDTFKHHGGETAYFTLDGIKTFARVVDVYDGDTMTLVLQMNGVFLKFKTRMAGIDTCEMRSKNLKIKRLAIQARNRLISLVTRRPYDDINVITKKSEVAVMLDEEVYLIWVHCLEFDKYGRLLADCYSSPNSMTSFSTALIHENLAYNYEGDTKLTEEQQIALLCP